MGPGPRRRKRGGRQQGLQLPQPEFPARTIDPTFHGSYKGCSCEGCALIGPERGLSSPAATHPGDMAEMRSRSLLHSKLDIAVPTCREKVRGSALCSVGKLMHREP